MSFVRLPLIVPILLAWAMCAHGQDTVRARKTIKVTVQLMSKAHLKKRVVDRGFCKRWVDTYLDALDPAKLYFLASDISEFAEYEDKLPEFAVNGDTEFLELVAERYQTRASNALENAIKRIDRPFDFSINEHITLQYEDWAASDADRSERWRKQLKYDLLIEKLNAEEKNDRIKFLKTRYESIRQRVSESTRQKSLGVYLDSFCKTADPHSGYITQEKFNSFRGTKSKAYSIGLQLIQTKGRVVVRGVLPEFHDEPMAGDLVGCELIAIRTTKDVVHNLREIDFDMTRRLILNGLGKNTNVKLELYDESTMHRFAVVWPRR